MNDTERPDRDARMHLALARQVPEDVRDDLLRLTCGGDAGRHPRDGPSAGGTGGHRRGAAGRPRRRRPGT